MDCSESLAWSECRSYHQRGEKLITSLSCRRKDKEEEAGRINGDAVGRGLLRVPRSMLVVEKVVWFRTTWRASR